MATSLELDEALRGRLQRLAERKQRSPDWIMREAVAEYVKREEAREDFRQEAVAAWEAYQANGRHLSGEEMETWLESWGTVGEAPLPECHD